MSQYHYGRSHNRTGGVTKTSCDNTMSVLVTCGKGVGNRHLSELVFISDNVTRRRDPRVAAIPTDDSSKSECDVSTV